MKTDLEFRVHTMNLLNEIADIVRESKELPNVGTMSAVKLKLHELNKFLK